MDDEHLVHFHAIKTRKDSKETREKSWKGRCGEDSTLVKEEGKSGGTHFEWANNLYGSDFGGGEELCWWYCSTVVERESSSTVLLRARGKGAVEKQEGKSAGPRFRRAGEAPDSPSTGLSLICSSKQRQSTLSTTNCSQARKGTPASPPNHHPPLQPRTAILPSPACFCLAFPPL